MKLLLDTHVLLWMVARPEELSSRVRGLLEDSRNQLFLSAASAWEIALLWKLKRISLPTAPGRFLPELMSRTGVLSIPITQDLAIDAACLPLHHRDPFDRLLVATARREKLPLLSRDTKLDAYSVNRLWQ